MKLINDKETEYSIIIFDTAPTGHTLKLLGYPDMINRAYDSLIFGKSLASTFLSMAKLFVGNSAQNKLDKIKTDILLLKDKLCDPDYTTFISVCIPEYLSIFENKRLVQKLLDYEIDTEFIIVNQIIEPDDNCKLCCSRKRMQDKYLAIINDVYIDDFTILKLPLVGNEIRGVKDLLALSEYF
jgi:arsenite/tail-anchored protein-transporting ATPase